MTILKQILLVTIIPVKLIRNIFLYDTNMKEHDNKSTVRWTIFVSTFDFSGDIETPTAVIFQPSALTSWTRVIVHIFQQQTLCFNIVHL